MASFQLKYLTRRGAFETVHARDADEAEELARRRLLFREPGFAIAVCFEGIELSRLIQRAPVRRSEGDIHV